ncbi:estradiol 17-beta-dehydrogenase 11-like isoform X4 [Cataglyphis hispanica]|uniref:estradiol 17-beta-dehydrogenase 11-like isoform X2 n=1 Tax=Cataglyphis hispanica TaxID=1086592 RepID=UPI00218014FA|nr:estradiol 17-beta-dehydrogenase 11-like isoform X2 [Cataglyphis hispanica]XP_050455939.1 estradiol 17-beta-dehydrogenase 11-like isoform X3 [Cataglyphis hispanica]XP_050455940.1 estradiol 17-beta-dehydrogenase 11-like isoform X4 [Cataglyphis hispanica]
MKRHRFRHRVQMMLSIRDEAIIVNSRTDSSINIWFYLSIEFLIGAVISGFLSILNVVKLLLPKPPRDLTGDVVLIIGASSTLGESLTEAFAKSGCSVICVDNNLRYVEEIIARLKSRYCKIEEIGPNHREHEVKNEKPVMMAYECDLLDRNTIREIARKIGNEIGGIDVLVTCAGQPNQDIFNMASTTLMSHYWMMLAFLPLMLQRSRAYIVGVTPVASTQDAYLSSRAAIAGLMESVGQELSDHSSHLTFLTISPIAERGCTRQKEQQVAEEVVQAVSRDQSVIGINWYSKMLYRISCMIHSAIMTVTQWLHTQGCDYSF